MPATNQPEPARFAATSAAGRMTTDTVQPRRFDE